MSLDRTERRATLRVLVIDDDAADRALVRGCLRSDDADRRFEVTDCEDAETAREVVAACTPDLVLVDYCLPRSNGLALTRELQGVAEPEVLPVVLLTDCDREDVRRSAMQSGAQDYLLKNDLTPRSLRRAIQHAVERADLVRQMRATMRSLEEARAVADAANAAKNRFVANVSHEVRTPLTAIMGFADLALSDTAGLTDAQKFEAVQTIRRNGEHLLAIVNDILDLSKIEAGKLEFEVRHCDPIAIARDVVDLMRVRADAKSIDLALECAPGTPRTIRSDPTRLRQVLANLVGNAIKFTIVGGVRVTLESVGDDLSFAVIDSGVGIAEDQVNRVFVPFAQADAKATRRFGGTGLGLSISRSLARLMGGDLVLQGSKLGVGSCFRLTLPAGQAAAKVAARDGGAADDTPPPPPRRPDLDGYQVLLAEDGPDIQRLLSFLLSSVNAQVTIAGNGRIAVELVRQSYDDGRPFDVVLMDMQMPEMDGLEALTVLRAEGYDVPVIALTASAMESDRQRCLAAGFDDYETKPVNHTRVLATVQRLAAARRRC
ncbi:MAG: response regulator [Planctomycetota bacterium]